MKEKLSLPQTSLNLSDDDDDENFSRESTRISSAEDLVCLNTSYDEKCGHLPTTILNQMQTPIQCVRCQELIFYTIDDMDAVHVNPICGYCGATIFDSCNNEEAVLENMSTTTRTSIGLSSSKARNFARKSYDLKNDVEVMKSNIQDLNHKCIQLQQSLHRLREKHSSLENTCQQQNLLINELKSDQQTREKYFLELQKKIEDLHYASYDGSLIWRIDHFAEKFEAARSEQQTTIYSPIFYSSSSGYKMRARLDLYGDGHAKGTHMSIFVVLLKGDYDPILTWPFAYLVTFCLFDQSEHKHHIIDSFRPDANSTSFQKPRSDMNIASGILKFCPIAAVEQEESCYVKGDTMFIKVMVDFLGIPQAVLPYTLAINPGLPIDEQAAQRQIEIKKFKQLRVELEAELVRNDEEATRRSLHPTILPNNDQHAEQQI